MIPYTLYKLIHLVAIFFFLTTAAVLLLSERKTLALKITTGVASFFILLGGMGLMARLGGGFQPWILVKIGIWLVITGACHMIAKRFPRWGMQAYLGMMVLAAAAAYFAIYKPV